MREDLLCLDPENGELLFDGYVAESLSPAEKQEFERHLKYCVKCHQELQYVRWMFKHLEHAEGGSSEENTLSGLSKAGALQVSSIYDWGRLDLSHHYHEKPLLETLAASQKATGILSFPIVIEYLDSQAIAQFWKRAGHLSFRFTKCPWPQGCLLVHQTASARKIFNVREGTEVLLGSFHELVESETPESILKCLRQFQLFQHSGQESERESDE